MRRVILLSCLVPSLGFPCPSLLAQSTEAELARGIRLVEQGEYAQAILVLDAVAQKRGRRPQDRSQAAQAHLYLGIAYVGEGQETLAKASFREALSRAPGLNLRAFDVSPKVREVFQRAKDELERQKTPPAARKKGGSKALLIVVGGVALAGGGVAVAVGSGDGGIGGGGLPLTITVRVINPAPPALPIVGSEVVFQAEAQGTPSYSWDFGDGSTGTGSAPRHTYLTEGSFSVVVTAASGGRSVTGQVTVMVRSVSGTWDGHTVSTGDRFVVRLVQSGRQITGDVDGGPITGEVPQGTARSVRLGGDCPPGSVSVGRAFIGTCSDDVTVIAGTGSLNCRAFADQTLTRRP
jgi:hypothetical protein